MSKNIIVISFILIMFIFSIFTFIGSKITNENFSMIVEKENLRMNLQTVDLFDKKQLKFNEISVPSKEINKYQTFYDCSIYPELNTIDYSVVKNEIMKYNAQHSGDWTDWPEYDLWKNNNSSWKIIPLMAFTKWSNINTKKFPETTSQLKKIKGLVSAGFSKLGPNTTLKLHKGWSSLSNNVLRCHLGLIVPELKCKVFVIGQSNDFMYQKENKWIIFDDSLYHSASNDDETKDRIILLLDIMRPNNVPVGESDVENSNELNDFIKEFN